MDSGPDDNSDSLLIERLQAGDDQALNELMERYRTPLYHYIYRFVHNAEDAADLLEETFVKLYFQRDKYKPKTAFRSWLFTIAANHCRDWIRKRKRRPTTGVDEFFDSTQEDMLDEVSPANAVVVNEEARQLRRAIDRLPHNLKQAVTLFHLEEKSHQETATLLGCTSKAIETRLYQARKRLRQLLPKHV